MRRCIVPNDSIRVALAAVVAIGVLTSGTVVLGHGQPIDISVDAGGRLVVDQNVYVSELNLIAGTVLTTTLPGFGVETPDQGLAAGDELTLSVLASLLYWDGSSLVSPTASLLLDNPALDQSYTIGADSGLQTGMVWGTYDGDTGWHRHGDYTLLPADAPPGAYGIVLRVDSPSHASSSPFLIAFNHGLSSSEFDAGVAAMMVVVPEPGSGVLMAAGLGLLAAARRRRAD